MYTCLYVEVAKQGMSRGKGSNFVIKSISGVSPEGSGDLLSLCLTSMWISDLKPYMYTCLYVEVAKQGMSRGKGSSQISCVPCEGMLRVHLSHVSPNCRSLI